MIYTLPNGNVINLSQAIEVSVIHGRDEEEGEGNLTMIFLDHRSRLKSYTIMVGTSAECENALADLRRQIKEGK